MMAENNTTNESYSYEYEDEYEDEVFIPSAVVQFWTYLIFQIPSLFCTIFLLFYFVFKRRLRRQLHNHVIIILIFICFIILVIDNSLYLDGWRSGHGNSFMISPGICLFWWLIDYGLYGGIAIFLVWASFERHLLVFHRRKLLNTDRQIFYLHYCPLIILSVYILGFYTGVIIFPPCQNVFYYNYVACGSDPCYHSVSWINTWDYLINGVLCSILEGLFSITLLVRTIWKKYYSQRRFQLKKYRKMIIQLLSISSLSMSINLPQSMIILIRQIQPGWSDFGSGVEPYLFYLTGYLILFLPIISFACLPELWSKLFFCWKRHQRTIAPHTITFGRDRIIFVRPKDHSLSLSESR